MLVGYAPTRTCASMASALISPHAVPSGVSLGQSSPHDVLCSMRGLGALVSREMGVLTRRMLEMVASTDMREIIWTTPVCVGDDLVLCADHVPVLKAYRKALVMRLVPMSSETLAYRSLLASLSRAICALADLSTLR